MRLFVIIFLYGFLLDAILSVADEWLPITPLRSVVAWTVFTLGLVLYVLTAFVPRLPKRLILPPAIFLIWVVACGAFPLAFVIPAHLMPALEWTQLLMAIGLIFAHRRRQHVPPPLITPTFSWRNFAFVTVPTIIALPFVLIAATLNAFGTTIESQSGGYVKVRPAGLLMEERDFTRDGRQVRLISMMHIGERDFYDHILASLPRGSTSAVLIEGVTDDQGLLKGHFSYAKIAEMFGLASQEKSEMQRESRASVNGKSDAQSAENSNVQYHRADVDISTFTPLTLAFLNAVGVILADPTMATLSRSVQDPDSPFHQPDADKVVMHDILEKRNEHLIVEIDKALENSQTVVVPWGAMHLPFIEAALVQKGFRETQRIDRPIIRFWRRDTRPAGK